MALASMSGVTALTTSRREMRSAGTESIDTPRVPNSAGVPTIWPLMVTLFRLASTPRTIDEAALALIDIHRHAGNAPQRFGGVVVRKPAHRIG